MDNAAASDRRGWLVGAERRVYGATWLSLGCLLRRRDAFDSLRAPHAAGASRHTCSRARRRVKRAPHAHAALSSRGGSPGTAHTAPLTHTHTLPTLPAARHCYAHRATLPTTLRRVRRRVERRISPISHRWRMTRPHAAATPARRGCLPRGGRHASTIRCCC